MPLPDPFADLEPRAVWSHFAALTRIARPSGLEAAAVGYVRNWAASLAVLLLLPVAYFSVRLMRWWSQLVALSQRPAFKRARTG